MEDQSRGGFGTEGWQQECNRIRNEYIIGTAQVKWFGGNARQQ